MRKVSLLLIFTILLITFVAVYFSLKVTTLNKKTTVNASATQTVKFFAPTPTPNLVTNFSPLPSPAGNINYLCEEGKTAFDILVSNYKIGFKSESFGKMVTSINGVAPTGKNYWAFYINGKLSNVGADSYSCKGTEKIDWKLESY